MKKINVLMTGAGAPGGPGIIKALTLDSTINLITCDINPNASGRYLSPHFVQVPRPDSDEFIEIIMSICVNNNIDVILPLVTKELIIFSKYKDFFHDRGIKIIVSDHKNLLISNNKSQIYNFFKFNGLKTPAFDVVNSFVELEKSVDYFLNKFGSVCLKPSISNGSRGVRIIDNNIDEFNLLFNEKPSTLYISKDHLFKILKSNTFPELLLSEVLPGAEYSVDTLIYKGQVKLIVPRIRNKMSGGISVQGKILRNDDIENQVLDITSKIELHGPIGFQFKQNINGEFRLLEINPRIQGTSTSLIGSNINLPLLSVYQEHYSGLIDIPEINWDVNFVRYYSEIFY